MIALDFAAFTKIIKAPPKNLLQDCWHDLMVHMKKNPSLNFFELMVPAFGYPFHVVQGALCNFPRRNTGSYCLTDPECVCICFYKFWRPVWPAHINIACIIEILANAFQVLCILLGKKSSLMYETHVVRVVLRVSQRVFYIKLSLTSLYWLVMDITWIQMSYFVRNYICIFC